ncbi:hypothetical protein RB213_009711 [Colletotrichum asianum]
MASERLAVFRIQRGLVGPVRDMKSNFRTVREVYLGRTVEASTSTSTLKNEPSCGRPVQPPAPRFANQSNSRRVIRVPPHCVSRHRAVSARSSGCPQRIDLLTG